MITNHYLIVERWRPKFLSNAEIVRCGDVGHISRLSTKLYNESLRQEGSRIGTMLEVDRLPFIHSRRVAMQEYLLRLT